MGHHAHNIFLQTWYELGAVGALLLAVAGAAVVHAHLFASQHQPSHLLVGLLRPSPWSAPLPGACGNRGSCAPLHYFRFICVLQRNKQNAAFCMELVATSAGSAPYRDRDLAHLRRICRTSRGAGVLGQSRVQARRAAIRGSLEDDPFRSHFTRCIITVVLPQLSRIAASAPGTSVCRSGITRPVRLGRSSSYSIALLSHSIYNKIAIKSPIALLQLAHP